LSLLYAVLLISAMFTVPGCQRNGKDRNILSGHFRGGHRRTYNFCQLLVKEYDVAKLDEGISELEKSVQDSQVDKRRYKYNSHQAGRFTI
jgi:ABC-type microcin C transport system duplicated ATPase subunit YejF